MWEALKAELMPVSVAVSSTSLEPQDVEIVKEALSCLSNWVSAFQIEKYPSQIVVNDTGIMEAGDFLRLILQDGFVEDLISCLENFTGSQEPATKERVKHQSEAAGRVLAEASRACPSSCFVICTQVLTPLMAATGLLAEEKSSTRKECIEPGNEVGVIGLEVLLQIIIAARSLAEKVFQEHDQSAAKKWLDPLQEQSENLITAFHHAITDERSKVPSVLGGKCSENTMCYFFFSATCSFRKIQDSYFCSVLKSFMSWEYFCCSSIKDHHVVEDLRCSFSFLWILSRHSHTNWVPQIQHQVHLDNFNWFIGIISHSSSVLLSFPASQTNLLL